ncbi:hypothetical protein A9Z42_0068640 [Trichoderma parareesei]|uniref:J domain-containing protein n=1 Tax=Trichoderma parareesei TaxID=858221 RepID=A0A2H2ZSK6_TRIPA|nr:hypothetical protein A9Z42_0068640 [Trichoderma parareesei]
MAPSQATEDYYKFLGIPQAAGTDAIRASYRKLALKYHPDRNPNNPQATAQFQLLEAAYSTLFDPERRRVYDLQYESIKQYSARDTGTSPPPPQADSNNPDQSYELQIERLEAAIRQLRKREEELENHCYQALNEYNISQVALLRLQAVADRDAEEEDYRNSWHGYFFAKRQSEEEKQAKQRHCRLKRGIGRKPFDWQNFCDNKRCGNRKKREHEKRQKEDTRRNWPRNCERHKRLNACGGNKKLREYEEHKKLRGYEELKKLRGHEELKKLRGHEELKKLE